jgi:5-methylthioadenosine/S-adenosylhomocysteine deaminase
MATREGARALGMESELGSLEIGKRADVIVVDRRRPHLALAPDPYSTLVYAARSTDVRTVVVDGEVLVDDFTAVTWDPSELARAARREAKALAARAGF